MSRTLGSHLAVWWAETGEMKWLAHWNGYEEDPEPLRTESKGCWEL